MNTRNFFIVLGIIAFWEGLIRTFLPSLHLSSLWLESLMDTGCLSILSAISIWYFILGPTHKLQLKSHEDILVFTEQQLNALNQAAIVSVTGLDGKISFANDNFSRVSGYSLKELLGKDHRIINSGLHSKEFFEQMWKTATSGQIWRGEVCNKKKNGERYWVNASIIPLKNSIGKITHYVSIRFDITAEKAIGKALEFEKAKNIHMSRLAALGEMAGGMAHEINNPLAVIMGILSQNKRKMAATNLESEKQSILFNFERIENQITRISKIIDGLLTFAHTGNQNDFEFANSDDVINSVISLCGEKLRERGVQIEIKIEPSTLHCHPIQIEQVLLNLINNALDAIEPLEEKWIRVESHPTGSFTEISVTDSGKGIPPEVALRIMEPFFTTKPVGRGTGLGLSISQGIIENHGGHLLIQSDAPNTRFVMQIPNNSHSLMELLDADEAISAHLEWRKNLSESFLRSDQSLDADAIETESNCALGQWITKAELRLKSNPHFNELKKCHHEFHRHSADLIRRNFRDENLKGETFLGSGSEFDRLSIQIITKLQALNSALKNNAKRQVS